MKNLLIILFLFCSATVMSQKRVNVWYFGTNAGIDFNSGAPVNLTNGMINTYEGVASICDTSGSLLFYTDGVNVWNRNHVTMPNGTGLLGGGSSSQSAIIVPQPGNDTLYYLFAVKDGASGGLSYSKIDMNLSGGFGDVMATIKNVPLITPTAEKLTACVAQNGTDIWVMVHEWATDNFYAYLVTPTGINAPVISSVGVIHTPIPNQIGCMKTSHNGHQLAVAITYLSTAELFDFDNATGVISNPIDFTGIEDPYGVEFSPNNSKLYFSSRAPYTTKAIYQYDLNAGSAAAIIASKTYVAQSAIGANNGSMQLAPDKKIYIAHDNGTYLEVINDPDQPAASCGYVLNGFNLSPKSSQQGLPNYITTYFSSVTVENTCIGDSTYFNISASGIVAAQWIFDDPASGSDDTAYVYNPVHVFTASGTYNVLLVQYFLNGSSDSSYTQVTINAYPIINLGIDTTYCIGTSVDLNAGGGYTSYVWQDASTDSVFTASVSGNYFVTVSNNGCSSTDTVALQFNPCSTPGISFAASDTNFCEKTCLDFFDLSTNNPTTWQWYFSGASPDTSTAQNPTGICYNSYGNFAVTLIACNSSGCDSLTINQFINEFQNPVDSIWGLNDTLWSLPFASYQWYNTLSGAIAGATNQYYVPTQLGSYYCVVDDSIGCIATSNTIALTSLTPGPSPGGEGSIVIAPNPVIDILNINIQLTKNENIVFEIYDLQGRIIQTGKIVDQLSIVNIQSLANGVYGFRILGNEKIIGQGKFLKM